MINTINQNEALICPIDVFTIGYRACRDIEKELETHKKIREGLELSLAYKTSNELRRRVDVKSSYDSKSGELRLTFEVDYNWLRKYCTVSYSDIAEIAEIKNCKLYIKIYNTCLDECKVIYEAIIRCFIEFAREPVLLRKEEQAYE